MYIEMKNISRVESLINSSIIARRKQGSIWLLSINGRTLSSVDEYANYTLVNCSNCDVALTFDEDDI